MIQFLPMLLLACGGHVPQTYQVPTGRNAPCFAVDGEALWASGEGWQRFQGTLQPGGSSPCGVGGMTLVSPEGTRTHMWLAASGDVPEGWRRPMELGTLGDPFTLDVLVQDFGPTAFTLTGTTGFATNDPAQLDFERRFTPIETCPGECSSEVTRFAVDIGGLVLQPTEEGVVDRAGLPHMYRHLAHEQWSDTLCTDIGPPSEFLVYR